MLEAHYLERVKAVTQGAENWSPAYLAGGNTDFYAASVTFRGSTDNLHEAYHGIIMPVKDAQQPLSPKYMFMLANGTAFAVRMDIDPTQITVPTGINLNSERLRDGQRCPMHASVSAIVNAAAGVAKEEAAVRLLYYDKSVYLAKGHIRGETEGETVDGYFATLNLWDSSWVEAREQALMTLQQELDNRPPLPIVRPA